MEGALNAFHCDGAPQCQRPESDDVHVQYGVGPPHFLGPERTVGAAPREQDQDRDIDAQPPCHLGMAG